MVHCGQLCLFKINKTNKVCLEISKDLQQYTCNLSTSFLSIQISLPIVAVCSNLNFPWLWVADLVFCKSAHAYMVIYSGRLFHFFFFVILLIAKGKGNLPPPPPHFFVLIFLPQPIYLCVLFCRLGRIIVWIQIYRDQQGKTKLILFLVLFS